MKKILIATTALVAFAGAANAAEPIKLTVGGYAEQWVGYADNDIDGAGERAKVDVQGDNEIHFKGSTKLDNGLTVAFTYEHEADQGNTGGGINNSASDEVYITVSGGFGSLIVGQQDNVGQIIHNSAPDVGISLNDGDVEKWIVPNGVTWNDQTFAGGDNDADKIIYVTPAFAGLQAGISYTPDIAVASQGDSTIPVAGTGSTNDLYVGGFAYANKFGDVSVKADIGMGTADAVSNFTAYQGGFSVGYQGFTLGAGYVQRDAGTGANGSGSFAEGHTYDVGLAYATGPYAVSLSYLNTESQTADGDDEASVWILSGAYTMGPGVALKSSLLRAEYDDATAGAAGNDGWAFVTGLRLDF